MEIVSHASRQLKPYKQNYPTQDLELATVILLSRFRGILCGVRCQIYKNQKSLKYIITQNELNLRQRGDGWNH